MTATARLHVRLAPLMVAAAAVAFGLLLARSPALALAVFALVAVTALAFLAPVAHLTLLIVLTALVPYSVQKGYSLGLLLSDVVLVTGLLRAVLVLVRTPLDRRRAGALALALFALVMSGVQAYHGYRAGASVTDVGFELRVLAGWAALIVAMPVVADERARERLFKALLAVGLVVGLYGIAQYFGRFSVSAAADVGLREGVRFTSAGRGQVQGGLFAFPVAVVLASAALASGRIRSLPVRGALAAVLVLNAVSLLFTYERTFWVATVAALGFIALRGGWSQRVKLVLAVLGVVIVAAPAVSTLDPTALAGARERLLSLGQYGSDDAVRARVVEIRHAVDKIRAHPVAGWGLGDSIVYALPWLHVRPSSATYIHNGYLWLAWRLGLPAALAFCVLVLWAVAARPPPSLSALDRALHTGAQAALLALALVNVTFPSFRQFPSTAVIGMLIALCLLPLADPDRRQQRRPSR